MSRSPLKDKTVGQNLVRSQIVLGGLNNKFVINLNFLYSCNIKIVVWWDSLHMCNWFSRIKNNI